MSILTTRGWMGIFKNKWWSYYGENLIVLLASPLITVMISPRFYFLYVVILTLMFNAPASDSAVQTFNIVTVVHWASFVVTWTIYPLCAFGVIHDIVYTWVQQVRTFGVPDWRLCRETQRLLGLIGSWRGGWLFGERSVVNRPGHQRKIESTGILSYFDFPSYTLAMLLIYYLVRMELFLAYSLWSLIISVLAFLDNIRPPALLFLGKSGSKSFDLLSEISKVVSPLRIATMLDRDTALTTDSEQLDTAHMGENFRTLDDHLWRDSVNRLIEIVPVVVLDTRERSAPLIVEATLLSKSPQIGKTIFVTEKEGDRPFGGLVPLAGQDTGMAVTCINARSVAGALTDRIRAFRAVLSS